MTRTPPNCGRPGNVFRFPVMPIIAAREGDPVRDPIERLTWDAYVAAIDAHDHHKTASTQRSRTAALLAWRHIFLLDKHGEAGP